MLPRGWALSSGTPINWKPGRLTPGILKRRRFVLWLGAILALGLLLNSPAAVHSQSNSPPIAPAEAIVLSIPENSPPGHAIGAPVSASEPNPADIVAYTLVGEAAALFDIEETTGQLRTWSHLDYEIQAEYVVQVRTTDRDGRHATVPVSVKVMNVDEAAQVILSPPIVQVGSELSATLEDPDGGISEETWQWAVSPDRVTWRAISGADSASYMPVATGVREFLRAQVSYTDGHGPGKSAETVIDTGLGSHRLNFPPEFPYFESGVRTVSKDILPFEYIGRAIVASDLDGDALFYQLTGEAADFFAVEQHSGRLMAKVSLATLLQSKYFGEVHASDGRGGEDSITVRIDVTELQVPIEPAATPVPVVEAQAEPEPEPADTAMTDTDGMPDATPTAPVAQVDDGAVGLQADTTGAGAASSPEPTPTPRAMPQVATAVNISTRAEQAPAANAPSAAESRRSEPAEEPSEVVAAAGPVGPSANPPGDSPSTGAGQERGGLWGLLGFNPAWILVVIIPAAMVAAVLVARQLQARGRGREREVTLPPPTFGVERRLAPLPRIVSAPPDDATA